MAAIGRRTRISAALRIAVPSLAVAAFTWIALRFAASASLVSVSLLLPAAIVLALGVLVLAVLRAALTPVPAASAVRELDRRAGAAGRVIAAHELSTSADPFAKLAVADAGAAIVDACKKLPTLFPIAKPAATSRAVVLLALAPVTAFALQDLSFQLWRRTAAPAIAPEEQLAASERAPLPTLAWVMKETKSLLSPLAQPKPKPTPVVVATPVPEKKRGDAIQDPEKKAYFDKVLANANVDTVGEEVIQRFTKELMSKQYETLVAEFMTRNVSSGAKYEAGGEQGKANNKGLPPSMKKEAGSSSGMTKPAFDPSKAKSEYLKDEGDQESELLGAMKENFDIYLKEFAQEMLKGMEEALEKALSEPALEGNKNVASTHLKGLPNAPGGLSEGHEPAAPQDGPSYAMKDGDGKPTMEGVANMQQALGGTAAGGTGAGAGNEGQAATAGGKSDGKATGERVDLGGTLDERLAVVDVVQRMSGGTEEIEDSAAAQVVRKSTKAAEREAAAAEEIPEEYRDAVEAYFKALVPAQ